MVLYLLSMDCLDKITTFFDQKMLTCFQKKQHIRNNLWDFFSNRFSIFVSSFRDICLFCWRKPLKIILEFLQTGNSRQKEKKNGKIAHARFNFGHRWRRESNHCFLLQGAVIYLQGRISALSEHKSDFGHSNHIPIINIISASKQFTNL